MSLSRVSGSPQTSAFWILSPPSIPLLLFPEMRGTTSYHRSGASGSQAGRGERQRKGGRRRKKKQVGRDEENEKGTEVGRGGSQATHSEPACILGTPKAPGTLAPPRFLNHNSLRAPGEPLSPLRSGPPPSDESRSEPGTFFPSDTPGSAGPFYAGLLVSLGEK